MGALLSEVQRVAELNQRVDPVVPAQDDSDDGGTRKHVASCGLVQKWCTGRTLKTYCSISPFSMKIAIFVGYTPFWGKPICLWASEYPRFDPRSREDVDCSAYCATLDFVCGLELCKLVIRRLLRGAILKIFEQHLGLAWHFTVGFFAESDAFCRFYVHPGMETVNLVVQGFDFLPVFLITYMIGQMWSRGNEKR